MYGPGVDHEGEEARQRQRVRLRFNRYYPLNAFSVAKWAHHLQYSSLGPREQDRDDISRSAGNIVAEGNQGLAPEIGPAQDAEQP